MYISDWPKSDSLAVKGSTEIVWEDRWHEEEIFANRLSFYVLAQSFLVVAAVTATLSSDATSRWLPVALTIDLTGLVVTVVFWYAFTENLRRLDALKEIVSEGSAKIGVRGYKERSGRLERLIMRVVRGDERRFFRGGLPPGGWRTG